MMRFPVMHKAGTQLKPASSRQHQDLQLYSAQACKFAAASGFAAAVQRPFSPAGSYTERMQ